MGLIGPGNKDGSDNSSGENIRSPTVSTKRLKLRIGGEYSVEGTAENATAKNSCSIGTSIVFLHNLAAGSGVAFMSYSSSEVAEESRLETVKEIRSHEVAIAELNHLSSSRTVYQKNGNLFFRTSIQKATASEQKQLDLAKAKLQKLNPS